MPFQPDDMRGLPPGTRDKKSPPPILPGWGDDEMRLNPPGDDVGLAARLLGRGGTQFPGSPNIRLTLTRGIPVTTSDVTGATKIYAEPFRGDLIELFNGSIWVPRQVVSTAIPVPSTLFLPFDIFANGLRGKVNYETVNWNQSTFASTGATAANPCVVTVGAGHGLTTSDMVGAAGFDNTVGTHATQGINGKVWRISAAGATTITLAGADTAGLVASTTGTLYKMTNTRATDLTTQNGVLVKSGDASRRYLGTGCTIGVSGQIDSSIARRYLQNYYNRVRLENYMNYITSHTYNSSVYRFINRDNTQRVDFVIGWVEDAIITMARGDLQADASNGVMQVLCSLDSSDGNQVPAAPAEGSPNMIGNPFTTSNLRLAGGQGGMFLPTIGAHFVAPMERATAGTGTFATVQYGNVIMG